MEQPSGFVAQGESSGLVCRLRKSLYGLKKSPRTWFGKFRNFVQQFGMTRVKQIIQFFTVARVLGIFIL